MTCDDSGKKPETEEQNNIILGELGIPADKLSSGAGKADHPVKDPLIPKAQSSEDASEKPVSVEKTPGDGEEETAKKQDLDLLSEIKSVKEQLEALSLAFNEKIKYDAHKEKIIDNLHQELQAYREGIIKKHLHTVVTDIIKVIDDIRKFATHYEKSMESLNPAESLKEVLSFLSGIASDLEDIFSWEGIEPFRCEEKTFDSTRQRLISKVETDDPALDKQVAESLRPGYIWDGKIIRPEMVSVYVYAENTGKEGTE